MDINYRQDPQKLYGKIKQYDFFCNISLWIHCICGVCHKDIPDIKDELTDEKYDP